MPVTAAAVMPFNELFMLVEDRDFARGNIVDADVIIVGAGLAGLMGAVTAAEKGAKVLVLTRKAVGMASNSCISNGVFAGPTRGYPPETYIEDTFAIGKRLNSLVHIETVARNIGPAISFLQDAGCRLTEHNGHYSVAPARPDVIAGVTLMKTITDGLKGVPNLKVRAGFHVTDILIHHGRACGVDGMDHGGRKRRIHASAVILASGGAGAAYLRNDNQKRALGQGYAMALRAGLELRDMEFVQFYPFIHAEPGVPAMLLYPPLPEQARLIDAAGIDLAEKYGLGDLNDLILKKRDGLSAMLHREMCSGPVYMDFRGVPATGWAKAPLAILAKLKFDFRGRPFAVAPGVHFFMGGIATDVQAHTGLPGLFACGEVAWGLHGANRRGGNALAECMVFGPIAGSQAARWAKTHPLPESAVQANEDSGRLFGSASALARLRELGRRMRQVAWDHAGLVRTQEDLSKGLESLRTIEEDTRHIKAGSIEEYIKRWDQLGACLVLRAIFTASLARKESIGCFARKDFPQVQEQSAHGNSSIRYDAASDRISVIFNAVPDGVPQQMF